MERRTYAVMLATVALVASSLGLTQNDGPASAADRPAAPMPPRRRRPCPPASTTPPPSAAVSQPVSVAFAPDGTAFVALQTGVIKSFDYVAASGQFEAAATSTDFADLSVQVNNYGDRGMTGITVDPQFPARPYVYVNYTFNSDPLTPGTFPAWGTPGQAYDNCGPNDANEATLSPPKRGCPVIDRVSRLTARADRCRLDVMTGPELVLVQDGCAQFSSHSSGDVAFGPDGKLYASAGDGASFRGQDFGQANLAVPGQPACPDDPVDEGGSLRAQDQRTSGDDPLGIDGTIFRLNPDVALNPATAPPGDWLVAMGQRNPWRFTFRQGKEQLWSVDVGSSNWEEINVLVDAPTTALVNRGWPCYEGTTGQSLPNAAWQALGKQICTDLYAAGAGRGPGAVLQLPDPHRRNSAHARRELPGQVSPPCRASRSRRSGPTGRRRTRTRCSSPTSCAGASGGSRRTRTASPTRPRSASSRRPPARRSSSRPGRAATSTTSTTAASSGDAYVPGSGGVHRIDYIGPTKLTVKSSPKKVKIKVNGKRHKAPYRADFDAQTTVKLVAPKVFVKKGVRYVFKKWKGVTGKKAKKKRKVKLAIGIDDLTVKAIYVRQRRR